MYTKFKNILFFARKYGIFFINKRYDMNIIN